MVFYETREAGLGESFRQQVRKAAKRIAAHPRAWPGIEGGGRRCRLDRFPYALVYRIEDDRIVIGTIANLHRDPTRWQRRAQRAFDAEAGEA